MQNVILNYLLIGLFCTCFCENSLLVLCHKLDTLVI